MARRELRRKITATVLTVTALCCLLGVCAWLLLGRRTRMQSLSPGTSLRLRYPSPFRRNPRRGLWPRFLSLFPQSRNFSLPHKRFRKHRRSQRLCFRNRRRTLRPPAAQKRTPCACKPPAMHRKPAALPRVVPPKRLSLLLLRARLKKHVWLRRRSELRHPRLLSPHLRRYLLNALPSRRKPNSPVQTSG